MDITWLTGDGEGLMNWNEFNEAIAAMSSPLSSEAGTSSPMSPLLLDSHHNSDVVLPEVPLSTPQPPVLHNDVQLYFTNENMMEDLNATEEDIMKSTEFDDHMGGQDSDNSDDDHDDNAGGLFGSGSEDEAGEGKSHPKHKPDDQELDSGDDEDHDLPMEDAPRNYGVEDTEGQQSVNIADTSFGRHVLPRPTNGEVYLLKLPKSVGIQPKEFKPETFRVPTTDHHSQGPPSSTFSAAETSKSTIRWRRSPNDPQVLQSNARIIEWEDGSFTLQLASNPTVQHVLSAKALAPPSGVHYDPQMEAHTYLASIHQASSFAQITGHITKSLTIQTTNEQNDDDDALIRLSQSMAAAVKGNKTAPDGKVSLIEISEDPELAKKRAEAAEREKTRAQRRRQNQEEKERDRANRVLGRSGLRHGGTGAGLTVGGLEDDDGLTTAKPRAKAVRKPRRRNSEYSDDEDDFRNRGRTREDEYDEDDGFLVGSDEEPEVAGDDSEEEEEMVEEEEKGERKSKKKEPKAEKEDVAAGRVKSRRVVDDEDDE